MLLKFTVVCSLLFCSVSIAHADDASKQAKVQELFKIEKLDQLSTQMSKQLMEMMDSGIIRQVTGAKVPPNRQQAVDEFSAKLRKLVSDGVGWQGLEPEYAKLYAAAYTEQQLDDMIAFYKSPTGQAVVDKTPELLQQSRAIAKQRMAGVLQQIQQLAKDFAAQQSTTVHQATSKE